MAITGAIPLPGSGMAAFSGGVNNMLRDMMERQKMAQQQRQHMDNLGINRGQLELAQDKWNQEKAQYDMLQQLLQGQGQQQMPAQEYGQGMGMFTPKGLQQRQQQVEADQVNGGINWDAIRNSPVGRGLFKKFYGVDPVAEIPQTPEQKQAAAFDLFKQKEQYKSQSKGGNIPTPEVVTMHQKMMSGLDSVLPQLDQLISGDVPGVISFSPASNAAYQAKTGALIDTLMAAQGLPKVKESIHIVANQIRRQPFESVSAYKKRLGSLKEDLLEQRKRSQDVLNLRQIGSEALEGLTDEELQAIAGGGE